MRRLAYLFGKKVRGWDIVNRKNITVCISYLFMGKIYVKEFKTVLKGY